MSVNEHHNSQIPTKSTIEAAHRLAAIVESSHDAIVSKDLHGVIQSWNQGAERLFGFTAEEAIGQPITIVIPPELHGQEPQILDRIARGERIDRFETIRQRKDGSRFHVSLTVSPIRDEAGAIVGASKIGRDISDLRQGQERQELLLREMNHRIKNLFAVASGVVALSVRSASTPKELAASVQSRLAALSKAHELILPQGGSAEAARPVELAELVRTILSPYDATDRQLHIDGPAIACGPAASTSFALLLHEFATNSVKYGALADPEGHVEVQWKSENDQLDLAWLEKYATTSPSRPAVPGFGSFLVEATAKTLSGTVERTWREDGLLVRVTAPLARVIA